jgi:hypothetical protein
MSRRQNVVEIVEDPGKFEALSDEQKKKARKKAETVRDRGEKVLARLSRIEDPEKRILAAEMEVQAADYIYKRAAELRDDTIAETAKALPRPESREFTARMSEELFLSESRLRQIRVKDRLNTHDGSRGQELSRILTREFLAREYHKNGRTQQDIAQEVGCDAQTVSAHLRRYLEEDRKAGIPEKESPFLSRTLDDYREAAKAG